MSSTLADQNAEAAENYNEEELIKIGVKIAIQIQALPEYFESWVA